MVVDRPGYYIDFVSRPLFQALMRENLVYHNFYLPHVDLINLTYLPTLTQMKNIFFKENILAFLKWRVKNRSRFSIYGPEMKYKAKL